MLLVIFPFYAFYLYDFLEHIDDCMPSNNLDVSSDT